MPPFQGASACISGPVHPGRAGLSPVTHRDRVRAQISARMPTTRAKSTKDSAPSGGGASAPAPSPVPPPPAAAQPEVEPEDGAFTDVGGAAQAQEEEAAARRRATVEESAETQRRAVAAQDAQRQREARAAVADFGC